MQYCARFIPSFAIIASPLWDLTKAYAKWKWGITEEDAFQAVKMQPTQAPVMAFFKQGAETRITTDAYPIGIGAVLEEKQEDGQYRPVHYASRKLTPPESRYSQFEKEALAVKWSCEKFFLYIHGNDLEICTDQKPLTTVLGLHSKPPSVRIERWMLYMQQLEPTLHLVRHAITSGDWSKLQGTTYKAVRDELWIMEQLVMRGNKVVMPEKMWNQTIQLAHEGD